MKQGYKQTEVGVIPEDWEAMKLGEYARFRTGPFGSTLHKSDYIMGGIPIINPMHINDGQMIPSPKMSISKKKAADLAAFILKEDDIVIGRRGEMGRCAVVGKREVGWLCGSGSMIVRCNQDLHPLFLVRVLSAPAAIAAIEDTSVGTTMVNINQGVLSNLMIQLPPLHEQRRIAEALADVDGLLAALDKLIAKKREVKTAAMQQLLTGQIRLPGFEGEWAESMLGEVCKFYSGGTPATSIKENYNGDVPWITSSDLNQSRILSVNGKISQKGLNDSSAKMIKAETLLMALYGATAGEISISKIEAAINQAVLAIIPIDFISIEFLFHQLSLMQSHTVLTYTQGGQPNLSGTIVKSM